MNRRPDSAAHEDAQVAAGTLGRLALVIVLMLVVVIVALQWVWHEALHPTPNAGAHPPAPVPHLQPHPDSDRAVADAQMQRAIDSYGWVDRKAGIAHIPVSRAMQLISVDRTRPRHGKGTTR